MNNDIARVLIPEEELQARVQELGRTITRDYAGKDPVLVGILKGSFMFMADLARELKEYCTVDFMAVSSYGNGTTTTGAVQITKDLREDIEGRHVLIVEDILDSGNTLKYLTGYLAGRKPASIRIAILLDKPSGREKAIEADYVGFTVPDAFVVGYGLDYAERYRNLPYIGVLRPEVYSK